MYRVSFPYALVSRPMSDGTYHTGNRRPSIITSARRPCTERRNVGRTRVLCYTTCRNFEVKYGYALGCPSFKQTPTPRTRYGLFREFSHRSRHGEPDRQSAIFTRSLRPTVYGESSNRMKRYSSESNGAKQLKRRPRSARTEC